MDGSKLDRTKGDDWNVLASEYASLTAKTSLAPIGLMLSRANALHPFAHATGILDNGCGPGPVMSRIIHDYGHEIPSSSPLTCADFSDGMLAQVRAAKERAGAESPWARVDVLNQNAMDLCEVADGSVSHVTAGMVYFMVPDPQKALKESLRVLRPEGVLALSAWEGSEWLDLMNLLPKVRPDKTMPTMPGAWTSTGGIKGEMEKAGFRDVEVHECPVTMAFQHYESFARFFSTKLPHMVALTKDMSEEEVGKLQALMVEGMKKMCPQAPGALKGMSLVGVGRK